MFHRIIPSLDIMATLAAILVLIFLLRETAIAQPKQPISIPLGTYLHPTSEPTAWYSPSRRFAFGFFPEGMGFKVGIWLVNGPNNNTVVWCAHRDDPGISSDATLEFVDGKILLKTGQTKEKIIDPESAYSASMLDSGNFVVYNQDSDIIWESFRVPTDTILGGQNLSIGGELVPGISSTNHSSGRFRLEMQIDGNLVAYPMNLGQAVDAYWASQTCCNGKMHLVLNTDGSMLVVHDSGASLTRELHKSSVPNNDTIYRATIDYDGNFRLYSHSFSSDGNFNMKIEWQAIDNVCDIKGFCGLNSYCGMKDNAPYCICLPGTTYIDKDQSFGGCERDFTRGKCIAGKEDASVFRITAATNLTWQDPPYFVTSILGKEDCSKSCSQDCDCDAALYDGSSRCTKHKLPLRYVKSDTEGSDTAFFKVSNAITRSIEKDHAKLPWLLILVISLGSVAYYGAAIAFSSFFIFKFRILQYRKQLQTGNKGLTKEFILRTCTYRELKRATNGFKEELGKGSFGAVYRGSFDKGKTLVAVKRLEKVVEEGEREFRAEMRAIGRTRHKNLVRLIGYCAEGSKRLLVYEYMSNGCLANLLFKAKQHPDWTERLRIALNVARGIHYLHEECEAPIIHCDIKPQNILLDDSGTAKISDFGLAKLLMPDQTRTFTGVRGTRGYLAPEWQTNAPISVKVDVYSYGIVLLEIICCRRNIEVYVSKIEEIQLCVWAYKCLVNMELDTLVKGEEVDRDALQRMVAVAIWCIQDEPPLRPSMKQVLQMLEGLKEVPIPPCPSACNS
ncbi:PREDICTED: G-type lectin S-receptor-like serine/threonine-protein kinase LECRK2 [Ipomoea nil]|uniref:G-type lectin S-receptor-like serine/threonine-protein kinase LECRK2 n=1 Tax=Ipomoea nil TaxID=35883 RepID=UPI000901547F|nr:PREDICTED: G-type lectin S-receptor-like serine/threonine-protein kinase LECRK2 [Ipomoea nil]